LTKYIDESIKINYKVKNIPKKSPKIHIKTKKGEPKILEKILELIYPPTCGICGKLNQEYLCNKCKKILEKQAKFEIENKQDSEIYFQEHLYIFQYQGIIRNILINYKFKSKSYLYKTIVIFLLKNKKLFQILKSYDTIIPVPISKQRRQKRGYNQSELIAREIAKVAKINYNNQCLFKTKNIIEQSKLNKEERQKNIQGVYQIRNLEKITNKKILLIDDIYTTGSTVNECSKILEQANPKKIGVLTIAKD